MFSALSLEQTGNGTPPSKKTLGEADTPKASGTRWATMGFSPFGGQQTRSMSALALDTQTTSLTATVICGGSSSPEDKSAFQTERCGSRQFTSLLPLYPRSISFILHRYKKYLALLVKLE